VIGNRRFRLSYANVIASLALFVALGGSSYAAIKLPAGSVGAKQLRTGAVTSAKVKNGSLARRDFRPGELAGPQAGPAGPAGPPGPTGAAGKDGQPGAPGRSALEPLRSGETIRGVVGAVEHVDTGNGVTGFGVMETFPIPAPQPVPSANVAVDGTNSDVTNRCTGTVEAPTAPPGVVCVYRQSSTNAEDLEAFPSPGAASRFGFEIQWGAPDVGQTSIRATWAYQAP
jgi:hypothetical protein